MHPKEGKTRTEGDEWTEDRGFELGEQFVRFYYRHQFASEYFSSLDGGWWTFVDWRRSRSNAETNNCRAHGANSKHGAGAKLLRASDGQWILVDDTDQWSLDGEWWRIGDCGSESGAGWNDNAKELPIEECCFDCRYWTECSESGQSNHGYSDIVAQ